MILSICYCILSFTLLWREFGIVKNVKIKFKPLPNEVPLYINSILAVLNFFDWIEHLRTTKTFFCISCTFYVCLNIFTESDPKPIQSIIHETVCRIICYQILYTFCLTWSFKYRKTINILADLNLYS